LILFGESVSGGGNRIVSAGMKGLALENTPRAEQTAFKKAVCA
jgi:hypothetical protein